MNQHTHSSEHHDVLSLVADARELLAATADVAGEKVVEARKRLADALERAKEMAGDIRDKTVAGAKAADQAINEHPYKAIAIAFGMGALAGFLMARKNRSR
jgi:ElaB/YqjD/DUF883 family membrane-anchored ribosome-binding protein